MNERAELATAEYETYRNSHQNELRVLASPQHGSEIGSAARKLVHVLEHGH